MSTVLVDRRTGSEDLVALLPRGYAELTDLEFADAVVIGNGPDGVVTEAFERKRVGEAITSMQDGRFAGRQLRGLRLDYDFIWIVIEDDIRAHPQTGILQRVIERQTKWSKRGVECEEIKWANVRAGRKATIMYRDFQHWLLTMCRKGGVHSLAFTRSAEETAALIWIVNTWRQKAWKAHTSCDVFNTAHGVKSTALFTQPLVGEIVGRLKDVGWHAALAIADRYKRPEDFAALRATEAELASLVVTTRKDGVKVKLGKVLAKSIVEQWKTQRGKR